MDSENVVENLEGSIKIVKYNKPRRKNAIDVPMYLKITRILNEAACDDNVTVAVITGTGDYYSSGNDFVASVDDSKESLRVALKDFIQAFITFPKLLVAIVNGPAIGIAATTLALCDLVFAAENSFFYTPFTKLGIVAEGCSTVTFPRLMGDRKAIEMLLFNYRLSAKEALDCGFINYLFKPEELQTKVWDKITEISQLPKQSIVASKRLLRSHVHQLLQTNEKELEELHNIWAANDDSQTVNIVSKSKL